MLLTLLWLILVYTPIARPSSVLVRGVAGPSQVQIRHALEEAGKRQSTVAVNHGALMAAVAQYPEVADIKIASHPPDGLALTAVMRLPVAIVNLGGRDITIAGDGRVLSHVSAENLPRLDGSFNAMRVDGGALKGARGPVAVLAAAPGPLLALARTVRLTHAGVEVEMTHGPRLIFGTGDLAAAKWAAAAAIIADGSATTASYIDLRVPSRPAVGGVGGSRAAVDAAPPVLSAPASAAAGTATQAAASAPAATTPGASATPQHSATTTTTTAPSSGGTSGTSNGATATPQGTPAAPRTATPVVPAAQATGGTPGGGGAAIGGAR